MKKFFLIIPFLSLVSCTSALYQPTSSINNVSLEDLNKGRAIYVSNCAACHSLHLPNKYNNKVWKENLDEMQVRAKITNEEKELIYQYLINAPKK